MAPEIDQRPAATTPLAAFLEGCLAPWDGLLFMRRNPSLWRYGVVPILLNLIITVCILVLLLLGVVAFGVYLHPRFPEGWFGVFLEILGGILLLILALGTAATTWLLLGGILCGHYYGQLARQVELRLGTPRADLKEIGLRYEIADALRDFAALVAVYIAVILASLVPVLGWIAAPWGALYFSCYILGKDFLDFPMSLRGMRRQEKRQFARQHLAHTLGLGAVVFPCGLVPVLGAVVLAAAATGAVLLHRRLQPHKRGQAPLSDRHALADGSSFDQIKVPDPNGTAVCFRPGRRGVSNDARRGFWRSLSCVDVLHPARPDAIMLLAFLGR